MGKLEVLLIILMCWHVGPRAVVNTLSQLIKELLMKFILENLQQYNGWLNNNILMSKLIKLEKKGSFLYGKILVIDKIMLWTWIMGLRQFLGDRV